MERTKVWVDASRCQGCKACVAVCPAGAIRMVNDKAHVDEATCTGCGACIETCPKGAIQPVETVEGELIPEPVRRKPGIRRPSPLAETAGATIITVGVGLLLKVTSTLARAIGRWLTRSSRLWRRPSRRDVRRSEASGYAGGQSGGRQRRRRQRGGRTD